MSSFRIRPVFRQTLDCSPSEARERIVRAVEAGDGRFEIKSFPGFVCLRIAPDERHFWSPRLNLSLEEDHGGGTVVHGTYGPNANVWSLFLYAYLVTGLLALFSGVFGFSQWMIGQTAWGLWVFGAMAAALAGLYLLAQFGQKLGARQMFQIHLAYEAAIGRMAPIR